MVLGASAAAWLGIVSGSRLWGEKKKEKKGKKRGKRQGGCPSDSEIVPPIAEVASLVLCWSPGQIPQFLLDSFSNQFPLHSAEAPFGSSQEELPPS